MTAAIIVRLKKVLNEVYHGNMTEMATAIGVNRTTLMRYVQGKLSMNWRTFVAISQIANIRLDWLERGVGGPDIQYTELSSATSIEQFGLPVFGAPLESAPSASSPNRLGMTLLAPPPYYGEKRYWVKMNRPLCGGAIIAGDHVLTEAIESRDPDADDVERLRVVKRGIKIQYDIVTTLDIQPSPSASNSVKICGLPIVLHRDLQG